MRIILSLFFAGFWISSAAAQSQPGIPVCQVNGTTIVSCPGFAITGFNQTFVDPGSLATGGDITALRAAQAGLAAAQSKSTKVLSGGVAMASALDFQSPADGKSSRAGLGVAGFSDQGGVAATYTYRLRSWDAGVGFATSRYDSMGKATVGYSW